MVIKSGHSNIINSVGQAGIADISELKAFGLTNVRESDIKSDNTVKDSENIKNSDTENNKDGKSLPMPRVPIMKIVKTVSGAEKKSVPIGKSALTEYLSKRKYYIFILCAIYVVGVIVGTLLINALEETQVIALCAVVDEYFLQTSSTDMVSRIFGNIAVNLVFILGIYLCGVTVFAPIVCAGIGLYKGLSIGFITGIYIIGGGTGFHSAAALIGLVLSLFVMAFFILVCTEAMSFSSFLFKSDESFKSNMSFKNIRVYSLRFIILIVLIALATIVQTVIMPLIYSWAN